MVTTQLLWILIITVTMNSAVRAFEDGSLELTESEQLASERVWQAGGELLPRQDVADRIKTHLSLIRDQYPVVNIVKHRPVSICGQMYIMAKDMALLPALNASEYGPLENVSEPMQVGYWGPYHLITFKKPYIAMTMYFIMEERFGFINHKSNVPYGHADNIQIQENPSKNGIIYNYIFAHRHGNCMNYRGCDRQETWDFSVDKDNVVKFLGERRMKQPDIKDE